VTLPQGTDPSKLFSLERSFSKKTFEHNGFDWEWEIWDDISMKEFNEALKSYTDVNVKTGEVVLQTERYNRKLIRLFVKTAPVGIDLSKETEIIKLQESNASVIQKLMKLFPYDPIMTAMPEEDKKKLMTCFETVK